jgi:hypothetical protein
LEKYREDSIRSKQNLKNLVAKNRRGVERIVISKTEAGY